MKLEVIVGLWFMMATGVMIAFILDWIMRRALNGKHSDIISYTNLCDVFFADDIALRNDMSQLRMQSLRASV